MRESTGIIFGYVTKYVTFSRSASGYTLMVTRQSYVNTRNGINRCAVCLFDFIRLYVVIMQCSALLAAEDNLNRLESGNSCSIA